MSRFTANSYLVCFLLYVGCRNEALNEVSLEHDGDPDDIDFGGGVSRPLNGILASHSQPPLKTWDLYSHFGFHW